MPTITSGGASNANALPGESGYVSPEPAPDVEPEAEAEVQPEPEEAPVEAPSRKLKNKDVTASGGITLPPLGAKDGE